MTNGRDFCMLQLIERFSQQSNSFRAVANLTPGTGLQSTENLECRQKVTERERESKHFLFIQWKI